MKKFAMIQMSESYEPETHKACFYTPGMERYSLTVRNMEEAKALLMRLVEEGFGAVELCGSFGEENARALMELTEGKIAIGYVVSIPEQEEQMIRFWSE